MCSIPKDKLYMKQGKLCALIVASLLCAACSNPQTTAEAPSAEGTVWEGAPVVASIVEVDGQPVTVLDWSKVNTEIALPLSHFIEDLEIVKLEKRDEALVEACRALVSDHYILVGPADGVPFKLFDRQGKYLCNVGSYGDKPGEYNYYISHFQLDEAHNRIYIALWQSRQILAYDLNGKFVEYIPLATTTDLTKPIFHVDADRGQITVATSPWANTPYMVWTQDMQGRHISGIPSAPYEVKMNFSSSIDHLYNGPSFEFAIQRLSDVVKDTLYHYHPDREKLTPVFTIDYADAVLPHGVYEHPTCFVGASASGAPIKERLTAHLINFDRHFIVDKQTLRGGLYRIYNDFLGDIPALWFSSPRYGYYVLNRYPDRLKKDLQEGLQNEKLSPDVRTRMQTLLDSIDENGNNYILLGKLKQPTECFTR